MPDNIPIVGDDPAWKRSVDNHILNLENKIKQLESLIAGLSKRV